MAQAFKYLGRKISISEKCHNSDVDKSTAEDATFQEIDNVGEISEIGIESNSDSYDILTESISRKAKGVAELSDTTVEVARNDADKGQQYMRMAGIPANSNEYLFKVENADGSVDYIRGPVSGPQNQGGGSDDFDVDEYTVLTNQWIHVYGDAVEGGDDSWCDLSDTTESDEDEVYEQPSRDYVEDNSGDNS